MTEQHKLKEKIGSYSDFFQVQIYTFYTLCKTKSFSKAGLMLNVGQSVVSRRVSALENRLGIALTERNVRPIRLTNEGRLLYQLIEKETQVIDSYLLHVLQNGQRKIPLRIGCITALEAHVDTDIVIQLGDIASQIRFFHGTSRKLLNDFDNHEIDIFISSQPFFERANLYRRFLFSEPNIIVAPKSLKLPSRPSWQNLRLCGLPQISLTSKTSNGEFEREYFNEQHLDFVVKVEVDHLEPFFSFIENGVGWGLVTPTFMATYPEKMKNIQILPMPSPIVSRDIYVLGRNELSYQNLTDSITKICQTSIHQSLKKLFIPYVLWSKDMFLTYGENNRKVPLFV